MVTESAGASTRSREIAAVVAPSPFDGGTEAATRVAVRDGRLVLTAGERSVAVRPVRAVMGHGVLLVTAAEPRRRLRLTFERYEGRGPTTQHYLNLQDLYGRLDSAGFRELLVALRGSGVPLSIAPRVRLGAGGHRANAWVSAYGLLFVELALFGVPAGVLAALAGGAYETPSGIVTAALGAGLAAFMVLAITCSPVPVLIRRLFEQGDARDPIRYVDTWAGRSPEEAEAPAGTRPTFVPGVPVPHAVFLVAACALYTVLSPLGGLVDWEPPAQAQEGEVVAPAPSWLDGDAISLLGYAGTAYLLVLFVLSLVQWRRAPDLYGMRWAPVIGAFFCFAFGQAGTGMDMENSLQAWLPVVIITMFVAFTSGRLAIGFGVFAAMAAFVVMAAFGVFSDPAGLLVLVPMLVLIAAIAARYFPGGGRLVPLPVDRAARVVRVARILWAATVGLGITLAVAAPNLVQTTG